MNIEKVNIDDLLLDPNNARKHSLKNIDAIKGSLTKFGQQKPVVIDKKNIIVAGTGTVYAAKELGWKEIQVVRTDLDGFMQSAYALADNRTAELAEWDEDILKGSLAALELENFDLESIGFNNNDMKFLDEAEADLNAAEKFQIEVTFPTQEEMKTEYERLCSMGLLVSIK